MDKTHAIVGLALEVGIIIVYITATKFDLPTDSETQYWKTLQDIHVMLFIGFGFLMVFPKRFAWSAVSLTLLTGTFAIQLGIIFEGLFDAVFCQPAIQSCPIKIPLNLTMIVRGDIAGVAALITMGAVLGKFNAFQLVIMIFFEMFFFSLNERLVFKVLGAADVGASIFVHLFGALFGVVVSQTACNKESSQKSKYWGEAYENNILAMSGTLFLFIYWPSFNGGLSQESNFHRVVSNTALALTASALTVFMCSSLLHDRKKFIMDHILNSTLAGGVMIGTAADQIGNPGATIAIGFFAGIISCFGFSKLLAPLEKYYHDTCGITFLHLVPGFIGAIIGVVTAAITEPENIESDISTIFPRRGAPDFRTSKEQAAFQVYAILVTIGIAAVSGKIVGLILRTPFFKNNYDEFDKMFCDDTNFVTDGLAYLTEPQENTHLLHKGEDEQDYQNVDNNQHEQMPKDIELAKQNIDDFNKLISNTQLISNNQLISVTQRQEIK